MKAVLKKSEAAQPFTFSFQDDAGKMVLRSENYKEKRSAANGVESVRKNCETDSRYDMKESTNGKFFFNLKASNGQIVATSALFSSQEDRAAAITALKKAAAALLVDDQC